MKFFSQIAAGWRCIELDVYNWLDLLRAPYTPGNHYDFFEYLAEWIAMRDPSQPPWPKTGKPEVFN